MSWRGEVLQGLLMGLLLAFLLTCFDFTVYLIWGRAAFRTVVPATTIGGLFAVYMALRTRSKR